jgi:hypothetical protein
MRTLGSVWVKVIYLEAIETRSQFYIDKEEIDLMYKMYSSLTPLASQTSLKKDRMLPNLGLL